MIVFPNCKINLGLYITAKREDGYHAIETIFYPVPFCDMLEVVPDKAQADYRLEQTGLSIAGDADQNLCVKAFQLLKKDFPALPSVAIYLHKQIPTGAGLGGGSADGAFMLSLLTARFKLSVNKEQLQDYALQLGSDCPFFLENKPVLASGRGEKMQPISLPLKGWHLVLLFAGLHIATKEAFDGCRPRQAPGAWEQLIQGPVSRWKDSLHNQFEETVFVKHPPLATAKQLLYDLGAVYASMTGTGSTLFGLFSDKPDLQLLSARSGYTARHFIL